MKKFFLLALAALLSLGTAQAQRVTDKLTRGLVAIPQGDKTGQDNRFGITGTGVFVSWRILPTEYYDTQYNLYRDNKKVNAEPLSVSNYQDDAGTSSSTYKVVPVVKGQERTDLASEAVKPWEHQYWQIPVEPVVGRDGKSATGYTLNDCSVADVDGDGQMEFVVKRRNDSGNLNTSGNKNNFNLHECYKMNGKRLWWIDMGPNLMAGPDEQYDLILYDWDGDGKAEAIMRGADNMIIHTASGKAINIGNMNYYAPRDEYTHQGAEYLLYLNGETGEPYGWDGTSSTFTPMEYPLPRFEKGETDYASVWGKADTGHRSCKHYFGAPYLDGRNPSIFLGRGCYTRHKFCALDVDPTTHVLSQRWRWNCYDGNSPWFGNGFHNFAIADVDMDGRDEIVFGSMIIDDTGFGLSTTGYGHGDAQHCTDLDPYTWGLEQFVCLESTAVPGIAYTDATSSTLRYTSGTGGDNGRCMAGNFSGTYPGSIGISFGLNSISLVTNKVMEDFNAGADNHVNMRIYWDGDLLDEYLDSPGTEKEAAVYKTGNEVGTNRSFYASRCFVSAGCKMDNDSKNNPGFSGDILGDWREEIVVRTSDNNALRIYTTSYPSPHGLTSLWYDHVYRNGMTWQCVGYNQPPQTSFFVGELEGITRIAPAITLEGRTEVSGTISGTTGQLLVSGYEDKTIAVTDGAAPDVLIVNAPAWVKGTGGSKQTDGSVRALAGTPKQPTRNVETFTTTLTGGAFGGSMNLVKQGEGVLVLPSVVEKHTGATDVWNGTLQFNGTMQSSPVWLNRHTTLISDGGQFKAGLKADYNATIYPGGKDHIGAITVSELTLGFGSRLVIDMNDTQIDQLSAEKLNIEVKTDNVWKQYGPKYLRPVIQFNVMGTLKAGKYLIGTLGTVDASKGAGTLEDIILEGLNTNQVTYLSHEGGKLYFIVEDIRQPASVVWNGTAASGVWDYGVTKNFLNNGVADKSVAGDDVLFNDAAENTSVVIRGRVMPKTITFANDTKAYRLTNDSIIGGATIIKKGEADVVINTENRTGDTYIEKGRMEVNLLGNKGGQTYGALGDASKIIHMSEGTTLALNGTIITDQLFNVEEEVSFEVPSGKSVIFNNAIKGTGAVVNKTGAGYLQLGMDNTFDKLVIKAGSVESQKKNNQMQVPGTIELLGGTFSDFPNQESGYENRADFIVPAGSTATIYGAPFCNYKGTLTGAGTLTVYGTGPRCYYQGDWSAFEGTLIPGLKDRTVKGSDVAFNLQNASGLPKATLQLNSGVTCTTSNHIEVYNVKGEGTLAGQGYTILTDDDIAADFASTAPIVKRGKGTMTLSTVGALANSVTVEGGTLGFNDTKREAAFIGGAVTLKEGAAILGRGFLSNLTVESGAQVTPRAVFTSAPGVLQVGISANFKEGSTLNLIIKNNKATNGSSTLMARLLTLNATVNVQLDSYKPAVGDKFTLWSATGSFSGTPKVVLPELPEGFYWNLTGEGTRECVLTVTDNSAEGIGQIASTAQVECEVYTLSGIKTAVFTARKAEVAAKAQQLKGCAGTYVVRMSDGRRVETQKVVLR